MSIEDAMHLSPYDYAEKQLQPLRDRLTRRRELLEMALPHVKDDHVANLIREELAPPPPLDYLTLDEIQRINREIEGQEGTTQIAKLLGRR